MGAPYAGSADILSAFSLRVDSLGGVAGRMSALPAVWTDELVEKDAADSRIFRWSVVSYQFARSIEFTRIQDISGILRNNPEGGERNGKPNHKAGQRDP